MQTKTQYDKIAKEKTNGIRKENNKMKIALINENSQASKNAIIYEALKKLQIKKDLKYITTEWKMQKKIT